MHTLNGVRFWRIAHLDGITFGLDRRWLAPTGVVLTLLIALVAPFGPLSHDSTALWAKLCCSAAAVLAVVFTSLFHELGHALASRLAGVQVHAIVVGPHGGFTIRAHCDDDAVNVVSALAGPLANVVIGSVCLAAIAYTNPPLSTALVDVAAIQFVTALVNLLPLGNLDGARALRSAATYQHGKRTLKTTA